jgi:hypothetical protein
VSLDPQIAEVIHALDAGFPPMLDLAQRARFEACAGLSCLLTAVPVQRDAALSTTSSSPDVNLAAGTVRGTHPASSHDH